MSVIALLSSVNISLYGGQSQQNDEILPTVTLQRNHSFPFEFAEFEGLESESL